jgi:hypothetical protein
MLTERENMLLALIEKALEDHALAFTIHTNSMQHL